MLVFRDVCDACGTSQWSCLIHTFMCLKLETKMSERDLDFKPVARGDPGCLWCLAVEYLLLRSSLLTEQSPTHSFCPARNAEIVCSCTLSSPSPIQRMWTHLLLASCFFTSSLPRSGSSNCAHGHSLLAVAQFYAVGFSRQPYILCIFLPPQYACYS